MGSGRQGTSGDDVALQRGGRSAPVGHDAGTGRRGNPARSALLPGIGRRRAGTAAPRPWSPCGRRARAACTATSAGFRRRRDRELCAEERPTACRRLWPLTAGVVAAALLTASGRVRWLRRRLRYPHPGGRVLDGIGNPWHRADVGITGDRIRAVGDWPRHRDHGPRCRRRYVTPGFIDVHSHAGPGLATDDLKHGRPLLAQGITTVFINPDGGGPVDLRGAAGRLPAAASSAPTSA